MTDKEIFEKYCESMKIQPNVNPEFDYILKETFSYKVFELNCAIADLKLELKNMLAEIKLRIKGVVG